MTLAGALSMSVAVAIAVYVESLGSSIAVTLLLVDSNAFEFAETFDQVADVIFDFSSFLLSEKQQLVANLIAAAVLAPIVEEFAKSLSVRFLMHASSTRAQCFVLGAAAGAAFGFLEALLYGAGWITEDLGLWWQGMVVRAGSTSGHVLWTGVGGVAWWYWSHARRHRLALLLFAAAVAGHAGWNAVFTIVDSRIFFLEELSNRTIEIIAYVIVAVWAAVELTAIPVVARRLREPRIIIEGTPLATMEAWMG
jgi:RsiW-degrading membrane proteinase PrsW (M82 family)